MLSHSRDVLFLEYWVNFCMPRDKLMYILKLKTFVKQIHVPELSMRIFYKSFCSTVKC